MILFKLAFEIFVLGVEKKKYLYSVNQKRQNNEISSILWEVDQRYFSAF